MQKALPLMALVLVAGLGGALAYEILLTHQVMTSLTIVAAVSWSVKAEDNATPLTSINFGEMYRNTGDWFPTNTGTAGFYLTNSGEVPLYLMWSMSDLPEGVTASFKISYDNGVSWVDLYDQGSPYNDDLIPGQTIKFRVGITIGPTVDFGSSTPTLQLDATDSPT